MNEIKETYEKIKTDICENRAFALHYGAIYDAAYGTDFYSEGIKRMCEAYPEFVEVTSDIACRYYKQDSGTAYDEFDSDECRLKARHIMQGRMSGAYDTKYGPVRIESNGIQTTMFFAFER